MYLVIGSRGACGACGADSKLTTLVNYFQLNLATSERIVFVRRAPLYSSIKEAERTLLQTQEV